MIPLLMILMSACYYITLSKTVETGNVPWLYAMLTVLFGASIPFYIMWLYSR